MAVADLDAGQSVRLGNRKAPQAYGIQQLENSRVCANTESKRSDGGEAESRSLPKGTSTISEVLKRGLEPQGATGVAAGFLDLFQSTELLESLATRFAFTKAGPSES